jgi:hypothetical protein
MRKVIPFKISYFKLEGCKQKFVLGDNLIVFNPNFSISEAKMIADIFDKLNIKDLEYDYIIDYKEALVSIHFGILI